MNDKKVNWGVIGVGRICRGRGLAGIAAANNARIYALASRSQGENFKACVEMYKPEKTYSDYDEMLDDPNVDAVYIALPSALHCEWTVKAADKKKHIMCEKPLASNEEQVNKMIKACEENGVKLLEGYAYLNSPVTQKVMSMIEEGKLGNIRLIAAHSSVLPGWEPDDNCMKFALGGGTTYEMTGYPVSLISRVMRKDPLEIWAYGDIPKGCEVDITMCFAMRFDGPVLVTGHSSHIGAPNRHYNITGDKGRITVNNCFNMPKTIEFYDENGKQEIIDFPYVDQFKLQFEHFGRCVLENETPNITYDDMRLNARILSEMVTQIHKKNENNLR